jgi:hypothetical protein
LTPNEASGLAGAAQGEVEGLKVSLAGAQEKLEEMERLTADDRPVLLGLPTIKRH